LTACIRLPLSINPPRTDCCFWRLRDSEHSYFFYSFELVSIHAISLQPHCPIRIETSRDHARARLKWRASTQLPLYCSTSGDVPRPTATEFSVARLAQPVEISDLAFSCFISCFFYASRSCSRRAMRKAVLSPGTPPFPNRRPFAFRTKILVFFPHKVSLLP